MTKYERVQEILANAAGGAHPSHDSEGRFWEKPLSQFRNLTIYGVKLIADGGPDRGERSGLIMALKGTGPFAPGGTFPRMPLGRDPVPPEEIKFIQDWIDDGLPDDELEEEKEDVKVSKEAAYKSVKAKPPKVPHRPCIANANLYRESVGTVKLRKNIESLTAQELATFRAAIQAVRDLPASDNRSYAAQATIHGDWCRHSTEVFLPWHRAYLYRFELILQEFYPGVTLPYWDWTTTRRVPTAYTEDPSNNPLFNSTRNPGSAAFLPTPQEMDQIQALDNFPDYGGREPFGAGQLELDPHNFVHVWVGSGSDMSSVTRAALDPLFWAHHCNVDRLWAAWQETNTGAPVGDQPMEPFGMRPSGVESVNDLGYTYAASDATFIVDGAEGNAQYKSGQARIPARLCKKGYRKAYLHLHKVQYPEDSYTVRVYLNAPQATYRTKTKGNPSYACRFNTFGHGMCVGGPGHCDPSKRRLHKYDLRDPHHYEPYPVKVDVTEALKRITKKAANRGGSRYADVQISLVSVGPDGKPMPDDALRFDSISLVIQD